MPLGVANALDYMHVALLYYIGTVNLVAKLGDVFYWVTISGDVFYLVATSGDIFFLVVTLGDVFCLVRTPGDFFFDKKRTFLIWYVW